MVRPIYVEDEIRMQLCQNKNKLYEINLLYLSLSKISNIKRDYINRKHFC